MKVQEHIQLISKGFGGLANGIKAIKAFENISHEQLAVLAASLFVLAQYAGDCELLATDLLQDYNISLPK